MAFEYVQLEEDIATTLFANYYYSSPEFEELVLRPPSPAERLRQLHERILSSTTASNDDIKYWTKLYEAMSDLLATYHEAQRAPGGGSKQLAGQREIAAWHDMFDTISETDKLATIEPILCGGVLVPCIVFTVSRILDYGHAAIAIMFGLAAQLLQLDGDVDDGSYISSISDEFRVLVHHMAETTAEITAVYGFLFYESEESDVEEMDRDTDMGGEGRSQNY